MLFSKKCEYCGEKYSGFSNNICPHCDGIDFLNVDSVTIIDAEMTYRTETEEEFDIVTSNVLSEMDGWQHYETETIEYEVENGYDLTFLIYFTDNTSITKTYHETHPIAQRLQKISGSNNIFLQIE